MSVMAARIVLAVIRVLDPELDPATGYRRFDVLI
jgi:hypothetical protein